MGSPASNATQKSPLREEFAVNGDSGDDAGLRGGEFRGVGQDDVNKVSFMPQDESQDALNDAPHDNAVKGERHERSVPPTGAESVLGSRDWYLGQNHKLFSILKYILPLFALTLLALGYSLFRDGEVKSFVVTPDFRVMEMPPLSEPYLITESRQLGGGSSPRSHGFRLPPLEKEAHGSA
jgi:hypothetical protein